jgi:hypothetical protein
VGTVAPSARSGQALGCPLGAAQVRLPAAGAGLENPPDKVRQQREQQQHKYASDPDQEVQRHFRRVDLFLIHASR